MMVHKREQQFIVFVRKQGSRLVFKGANAKRSFIIRRLHISLNIIYLLKCAKYKKDKKQIKQRNTQ